MVTVTAVSANTPINGFGIGIGEFFNPTPVELWDGMDASQFPVNGTVSVSKISIDWEFGRTTGFGPYSVTDQSLDPHPVPNKLKIVGPDGSMKVKDMTDTLLDTLIDGQTIAALMPGISNEEGFYRSLFQNNDLFTGSDKGDLLYSYDGSDTLFGGKGADEIHAGNGNDFVRGGAGKDLIFGDGGRDDIDGGGGDDTINGGKGNDTIAGKAGDDRLIGGSGKDDINGGSGRDVINGGGAKDTISGGGGSDRLRGDGGNDQINGQFGDDTISGGNGNDTLEGGRGDDTINGGPGNDLFVYRSFDSLIDLGEDIIFGFEDGADLFDFRGSDVFAGDVSIGAHADGTEITVLTANTMVTIVVDSVDPTDITTDDFLFPVV